MTYETRREIYEKEEKNKLAALVFVLTALLLPFFCWLLDLLLAGSG